MHLGTIWVYGVWCMVYGEGLRVSDRVQGSGFRGGDERHLAEGTTRCRPHLQVYNVFTIDL